MKPTKTMQRCKRCRTAKCKGRIKDPNPGEWVYWCGKTMNGWRSQPCPHYTGPK